MLLVANVRANRRTAIGDQDRQTMERDPDLRRRVNVVRSEVPAVTHVDYSARVQTVDKVRNPRFHALLERFHEITGCPVLVNTSFNVRGAPIVCTCEDAYACFSFTGMDALVLEDFVIEKGRDESNSDEAARKSYLLQFQLD
jgi:carbamoyltransferase